MGSEATSEQTEAEEINGQEGQQSVGDTSAEQISSESTEDSDQKNSDLDESTSEEPEGEQVEETTKAKGTKTQREFVQQLKQEKYDAIERADKLAGENAELTKSIAANSKPKADDYEDAEAYAEDYSKWKAGTQAPASSDSGGGKYQNSLETAGFSRRDASLLGDSFAEAQQNHDDFDQVVTTNPRITPDIVKGLVGAENPGETLHYLSTHPTVADSLQGISDPLRLAVAIGGIEAKMEMDALRSAKTNQGGGQPEDDELDINGGSASGSRQTLSDKSSSADNFAYLKKSNFGK